MARPKIEPKAQSAKAKVTTPAATAVPSTNALDVLFNTDCEVLINLVTQLKEQGLDAIFELPQIIVCGDQSSGKSSVLEAITKVPFPIKENLCTRFATQITIRREPEESIRTRIIPDPGTADEEKARLREGFKHTIKDFSELGKLIQDATMHMGLKTPDRRKKQNAFTNHKLSIEITGPDRLPLTLVDLPGWINSGTAHHTDDDKNIIQEMIKKNIKQDRTIVLAVISARSDLANAAILDVIKEADPEGKRTKGIITRWDEVKPQSADEKFWLDVARNNNIELALGWHMLRNRAPEERQRSFKWRDQVEKDFFDTGAYTTIAKSAKGIESLCNELSDLVHDQMRRVLPLLLQETEIRYEKVSTDLRELGSQRSTIEEQKKALYAISINYDAIIKSAVGGTYTVHKDFFGVAKDKPENNFKRLRSVVELFQGQFALQMRQYGCKYRFLETEQGSGTHNPDVAEVPLSWGYQDALNKQNLVRRSDAVRWVKELHIRTKGRELPGSFNSSLISELFHEQTENWHELAQEHIKNIHGLCIQLVRATLKHVASPAMGTHIRSRIEEVLERHFRLAHQELSKIIADKNEPVSIADPGYAAAVQKLLDHKKDRELEAKMQELAQCPTGMQKTAGPLAQSAGFAPRPKKQLDSDTSSAEKALDYMLALYSSKVLTFTENVTTQVIERNLLQVLANQTFCPRMVLEMDDDDISDLTAEPRSVTKKRQELEHYKGILEKSKAVVDKLLNPNKRRARVVLGDVDDVDIPAAKRPDLG